MFGYQKVAAVSVRPSHLSRFEDYEPLRDEDISFYGLITSAAQSRIIGMDDLPGMRTFDFTSRDRDLAKIAFSRAGAVRVSGSLEVCTFAIENPGDNPVQSDFYEFEGWTEHGLAIASHSLGLCSLGGRIGPELDNRGNL